MDHNTMINMLETFSKYLEKYDESPHASRDLLLVVSELKRLWDRDILLTALEDAGIDNWEGYYYAFQSLQHKFELVWLTEDLEGYKCKKCGYETLDILDDFSYCKGGDALCHQINA